MTVEIIAHRGSGRGWAQLDAPPENTLPAFAHAWSPEVNADAAELDVRLTRDGELVVIHDARVDRTTDGRGRVADLTFAAMRRLDAGSWKGYPGVRVPALEDVVATVPAGKRLLIEIKSGARAVPRLAQVLARCGKSPGQLAIISFGLRTIVLAKRAMPEHECYLVTALRGRVAFRKALIRRVKERGLDGIDAHYPASKVFLRRIAESGLKSLVWTVNDSAGARRMAARGAGGITTDVPRRVRAALERPAAGG